MPLDLDQGLEIEDPDTQVIVLHQHRVVRQLIVAASIGEAAQEVKRAQARQEPQLAPRFEVAATRRQLSAGRVSTGGLELGEESFETIEIRGFQAMDDVQVEGRGWRTVQDGGSTAYDDEIDTCFAEDSKESFEIGLFRLGHGEAW